jgi:hypothetical protein
MIKIDEIELFEVEMSKNHATSFQITNAHYPTWIYQSFEWSTYTFFENVLNINNYQIQAMENLRSEMWKKKSDSCTCGYIPYIDTNGNTHVYCMCNKVHIYLKE